MEEEAMRHITMTKVLHVILSFGLLMFTLTPSIVQVSGNTPTLVYVSERNFDPLTNETTVLIKVETQTDFLGFEFDLSYDKQQWTYQDIIIVSPFVQAAVNENEENKVRFAVMANDFFKGEAIIAQVKFSGDTRAEVMITRFVLGEDRVNIIYNTDFELSLSHSTVNHFSQKPKVNVTFSPENATIQDVTFISLDPNVVEVSLNGDLTPISDGEAMIQVITLDNQRIKTILVKVELDNEGPTFNFIQNPIALTNQDVELSITWSDTHDITKILYLIGKHDINSMLDNGNSIEFSSLVLTFESNNFITLYGKDIFDNERLIVYEVNNIDKTPPVITVLPYTLTPINQNITVTVTTNEGTLNKTSHTFTENGSFTFIATDEAGNVSEKTVTITNIDKTLPRIEGVEDQGIYNTNRIIMFDIGTALLNGLIIESGFEVTNDGSYELEITTLSGSRVFITFIIDKTPPVITVLPYSLTPINQDITVTVTTNEGTLNKISHTFTENGSFTFIATDDAGNVTEKTVTITNIDKIPPIITVLPYITEPTNQNITVTVTTNEGTLNKTSHTFTENGSFTFIATDEAGNVSEKTVTITNILRDVEVNIDLIGAGGSVELYVNAQLITNNKVSLGSNLEVRISPQAGYRLYEMKVNGTPVSVTNNTFIINAVNEAISIDVEFVRIGDLNGDGQVSTTDLVTLRRFLAGLTTLTPKGEAGADLDGNGSVTTTDLVRLRRQLAGLE
jgi:hypothetical protein